MAHYSERCQWTKSTLLVAILALASCAPAAPPAPEPSPDATEAAPGDGPVYRNGTDLIFPANYREWRFIGAGLGLTYEGEDEAAPDSPTFSNVFVNPSSYGAFMETGMWPDPTVFVLEFRNSHTDAHPNRAGRFQGELRFLEAEVKDSRFDDGWAFYAFGPPSALADAAAPLAGEAVAGCVECHTQNTAVERTFVQFYPTLMEVAREKGTVNLGF